METNTCRKKIVIIGAGASGIAAATRLYENGIRDIVVLEAEDRIGGRVNTVTVEEQILELGAQWIHGEEDNVVHKLASSYNLVCDSIAMEKLLYTRSNGEILEEKLSNKLDEIYWKLFERPSEYSSENFKSSGEFFLNVIENELKKCEYCDITKELQEEFIEQCHQRMNSYDASESWFETSITTLEEYTQCEGNLAAMWNKTGYQILFKILMDKSQTLSKASFISDVIRTNIEVEQISPSEDSSNLKVKCNNGMVIVADHVIVTVSLGVLKEIHEKMFENFPLPELKIRAINNLELGVVDKIYLVFSKPWWQVEVEGFSFLWMKADREKYIEKGLGWATSIFVIHRVEFAPNALCGWVTGENARIMESLDENVVQETIIGILRKFLGNKFEIPNAECIVRSRWCSNKHFRGSYSYRSVKTDEAKVSSTTLSLPVTNDKNVPVLLFAGEATSPHYYSSVHGAVETGWREADRLISFINSTL